LTRSTPANVDRACADVLEPPGHAHRDCSQCRSALAVKCHARRPSPGNARFGTPRRHAAQAMARGSMRPSGADPAPVGAPACPAASVGTRAPRSPRRAKNRVGTPTRLLTEASGPECHATLP
jgi:hypothetical protein